MVAIRAPRKHAQLVVTSSNFPGLTFRLTRARTTIGRDDDNDIVVAHASVSRHHAAITRERRGYAARDLRSTNGVRVNGNAYGAVALRRGDFIDLGHVRFRFVAPGERFDFERDGVITPEPRRAARKGARRSR